MLLKEVVMNGEFRRFALQNAMYSAPWIGRRSFLENAARHIFPTMRLEDLEHAKGSGGIRPQLVDLKERKMIFEIGTVSAGRRVLCIVTPSPGATMALDGALEDFVPRALKAIGEGHLMNHQLINRELDS